MFLDNGFRQTACPHARLAAEKKIVMNRNNTSLSRAAPLLALLIALGLAGCSKPDMPVSITWREAKLDSSLVAQFRNNSNRHLAVMTRFENKTLNQTKEGYLELPPMETIEIGWMEGWKFMSGEYLTLAHEDYKTLSVRMP